MEFALSPKQVLVLLSLLFAIRALYFFLCASKVKQKWKKTENIH